MFGTRKGLGILGEAGPEAILPLKRQSNGQLGVQSDGSGSSSVTVNIINNSSSQVEQRETTDARGDKTIEVVIVNAVKKNLADGIFDRQFNDQYGLRRKGA
jgi:phage-related minor tail protein